MPGIGTEQERDCLQQLITMDAVKALVATVQSLSNMKGGVFLKITRLSFKYIYIL